MTPTLSGWLRKDPHVVLDHPETLSKIFLKNSRGQYIPVRPFDRMLTTAMVKVT